MQFDRRSFLLGGLCVTATAVVPISLGEPEIPKFRLTAEDVLQRYAEIRFEASLLNLTDEEQDTIGQALLDHVGQKKLTPEEMENILLFGEDHWTEAKCTIWMHVRFYSAVMLAKDRSQIVMWHQSRATSFVLRLANDVHKRDHLEPGTFDRFEAMLPPKIRADCMARRSAAWT